MCALLLKQIQYNIIDTDNSTDRPHSQPAEFSVPKTLFPFAIICFLCYLIFPLLLFYLGNKMLFNTKCLFVFQVLCLIILGEVLDNHK